MEEQTIFSEALQKRTSAEWDAFLADACGKDAELRRSIGLLLRAHGQAADFLEAPVGRIAMTVDQVPTECPGTQIGPYKLIEKIGEGGMGVVYSASQQEPLRRKVALKIIRPGMDTHEVVRRFEAERQALAIMDQPNIAKFHDAGTTGPASGCPGRPYFVMELVKGTPITEYCDCQQLATRQRLELFPPPAQLKRLQAEAATMLMK